MAITIRNKETEAMLRRLGLKWGAGPSGVVKRLAEEELARAGTVTPEELERRMKLWDELMAMVPEFTEQEKREMQYEMDHMYDYLDEEGEAGDKDNRAAE
jgi:hypothetical protein